MKRLSHQHEPSSPRPGVFGREFFGFPLPVWCAVASCLTMIVGWNWDISWHRAIGRDTPWTLAHIAIYVSLAIAFAYNASLVLAHTFGALRDAPGVRVLGFKGPSPSFVTLWGVLMQFAAVLFDNWWHGVYGLDIVVFSPPHALLSIGITVFYFGQFCVIAAHRNIVCSGAERRTRIAALAVAGMILGHLAIAADPMFGPMGLRSGQFIASAPIAFAFVFVALNVYMRERLAAPISSLVYMTAIILMIQIFPLFPARPQFGPVFHRVGEFVPPAFPLVLVVPALAIGWVFPLDRRRVPLWRYAAAGGIFVAAFTATNWAASAFLMSPLALNRFFAGGYPGSVFEATFRPVTPLAADPVGAALIVTGVAVGAVGTWAGHRAGDWLGEVVR